MLRGMRHAALLALVAVALFVAVAEAARFQQRASESALRHHHHRRQQRQQQQQQLAESEGLDASTSAAIEQDTDLNTVQLDEQADEAVAAALHDALSPAPASLLDTLDVANVTTSDAPAAPAPAAAPAANATVGEPGEPADNGPSIEELNEMVKSIIMRPIPGLNATDDDSVDMGAAPPAGPAPNTPNSEGLVEGTVSLPRLHDTHHPPNFSYFLRAQNLSNDSTPITVSDRVAAYRALLKPTVNFPFSVEIFNKFDIDRDGVLSYREFRALLQFANMTNLHLNDTAEQQAQGTAVDEPWTAKHYQRYLRRARAFWLWVEQHIAEQKAHNEFRGKNQTFAHRPHSDDSVFWRQITISPEEAGVGVTLPASMSVPIVESIPFVLTDGPTDNYTNPTITYEFFVNNISRSLPNNTDFPVSYELFKQFDTDGDGGLNYTEFQNIVSYVNLTNLRPTDDAVAQSQEGNVDDPWTRRHYKKYLVQVKAFRLWIWRHMYLQRVHNLAMTNSTFREEWQRARDAMKAEAAAAQNTSQAFLNGPCSRNPSPCNDTQDCVTVSLPCDTPPCLSYKCVPKPVNPFAVGAGNATVDAKPTDSLEVAVPLAVSLPSASGLVGGSQSGGSAGASAGSSSTSGAAGSGAAGAAGGASGQAGGAAGRAAGGAAGSSAAANGSAASNATLLGAATNGSVASANGTVGANGTAAAGAAGASSSGVVSVAKDSLAASAAGEPEPRWKILMRQMQPVERVEERADLAERQAALNVMLKHQNELRAKQAVKDAAQAAANAEINRRKERRRRRLMEKLPDPTIEQMKAMAEWRRNQTLKLEQREDTRFNASDSSIMARHDNLTTPGRNLGLWYPNPNPQKTKPKDLLAQTPALSWDGRVFNSTGDEDSVETAGRDDLPPWDYINGGSDWTGVCAIGKQQSPIHLREKMRATDMYKDWADRRLELKYWPAAPADMLVEFTGKSLLVRAKGKLGYVLDGPERTRYDVLQVTFHSPSEHTADYAPLSSHGHFDAEMHIVHQRPDALLTRELLILSVFFQRPQGAATSETAGENNWLENDLDWSQLPTNGEPHIINHVVNLSRAAGDSQWKVPYFAYQGSLTVPPCTENVQWRILKQPLSISTQQLRRLTGLFAGNATFANGAGNNRRVQSLNYENRDIILM